MPPSPAKDFLKRVSFSLLTICLLAYVGICGFFFVKQRSMLYHPSVESEADMLQRARGYHLDRWTNKAGQPIGWVTPDGTPNQAPALLFPGNAGTSLDRFAHVQRLRRAGVGRKFYIVDYPGYGSRPGCPSERALVQAGLDALDSIGTPVVLMAESLGTGVAAQVAPQRLTSTIGMILLTPYDSITRTAAHHFPWIPTGLLVRDRFDSVAALKNFPRPVAVVVAQNDDTIPPARGIRLADSLTGPKTFTEVPLAGHNDVVDFLTDSQWKAIWDFADGPRSR